VNKNIIITFFILLSGAFVAAWLLITPAHHSDHDNHDGHDDEEEQVAKGPMGGRLLQQDGFAIEITLFEKGIPPEFHVYSYFNDKAIAPVDVSLEIKLARLGGQIDIFNFKPKGGYLRGDGVVTEPHSFDVTVSARYQGKDYQWQFETHEGRVQIANEIAIESQIKTSKAGPRDIKERLNLTGEVQVDPNRISHVRARFPGVVKKIEKALGQPVRRGDLLAQIQSNESLQNYTLKAPISGIIMQRNLQVGEATGNEALFTIVDLSEVWIELNLFDKDLQRVKQGQTVQIETLSGQAVDGTISWLSPMATHASQSIQARVVLKNPTGAFRPGQFVRGSVITGEHAVPLAVRQSAIQRFRDFQVVFARFDDTYEVRMLELGRSDHDWVEVLGGLKAGTEYVTDNSYLIKADIEKSGASHDH
jgi:cobalt-zinc-cadmium efflux system membrane fusion protein